MSVFVGFNFYRESWIVSGRWREGGTEHVPKTMPPRHVKPQAEAASGAAAGEDAG